MQARFPRLTPEAMTEAQREVAAEITAGPRGEVRGPFIALMHHPELARRLQQLGEQLRWGSKLPARLVELAVLITARRWTCQHEWTIHEKLARKAGLDGAIVEAIAEGREPGRLPPEEAAVYALCREAHAGGPRGAAGSAARRARFGRAGAL